MILDNLSDIAELEDENSVGQKQNFNMRVTKAMKKEARVCNG